MTRQEVALDSCQNNEPLKEEALICHKAFNEGECAFAASRGWIDRWRKKGNIIG
jgi:hypothetical protein